MTRTLVIVAHPDLSRSRINATWTNTLQADGRASVRVLTDTLHADRFNTAAEQEALAAHSRTRCGSRSTDTRAHPSSKPG